MSRNPSTNTVLIPVLLFLAVAYTWAHPWLLAALAVGLWCAWRAGRKSGRRGVLRRRYR